MNEELRKQVRTYRTLSTAAKQVPLITHQPPL